jgi:hypothetical protein
MESFVNHLAVSKLSGALWKFAPESHLVKVIKRHDRTATLLIKDMYELPDANLPLLHFESTR